MLRVISPLLGHLANSSFQVSLRQGETTICLQQRCGCTCQIRVTLTSGGAERRILLKLAISEPGCLFSDIYSLSCNVNHLLEFVDSVVNALYLHLDLRLQLVHGHFRRSHLGPGLTDFSFAAPPVAGALRE